MKNIFPILFFLLIAFSSSGQVDTTKTLQPVTGYGQSIKSLIINGMNRLPRDTFKLAVRDSGAVAYLNGNIWAWSGYLWKLSSGSGGIGSDTAALRKASNLSDIQNPAAAQTNLGLHSAALKDTALSGNAAASQVVLGKDTRLAPIITVVPTPTNAAVNINTGTAGSIPKASPVNAGLARPSLNEDVDTLLMNLDTIRNIIHPGTDSIFLGIKFRNRAEIITFQYRMGFNPATIGDMLKSMYDADNNGVVDNSTQLNGQNASYYLSRANHTGTQPWSSITATPTTLAGYTITDAVPAARTLTIDGVVLDLSANRSFTSQKLKSATRDTITQTAHGFTLLEAVSRGASAWVAADTLHWADGIVSSVINSNTFEVTYNGSIVATAHGKTVGTNYFIASTGGGATSTTSPVKSQPVFKPIDANLIAVNIYRPFDFSASFGGTGTGSGTVLSFDANDITGFASKGVTNGSSTPVLTYTLTNAANHLFWGRNSGSTGAPGYVQPAAADLSATGYAGGGTKVLLDNNTWGSYSSGTGSPTTVQRTVTQTAHGFAVLNDVYINGSGVYVKADTINWAVGVVDSVIDANTFRITFQGLANVPSHAKSVGAYYFATGTAGTTSTSSPTKSMPCFMPIDANTILITIRRPFDFSAVFAVNSFNGRVGAVVPAASDYNFNQLAGTVADNQLSANVPLLSVSNTWQQKQLFNVGSGTVPGISFTGFPLDGLSHTADQTTCILGGGKIIATFVGQSIRIGDPTLFGPAQFFAASNPGTNNTGHGIRFFTGASTGQGVSGDLDFYTTPTSGISGAAVNANVQRFHIDGESGRPTFPYFSGSGSRMVITDGSGNMSTQAIPGGGTGTLISFNGRATPAAVPATGDYTAAMVTGAVDQGGTYNDPGWLASLAVGKIVGLAEVGITGNFADILAKPTTLSGYGITDAVVSSSGTYTPTLSAITNSAGTLNRGNFYYTRVGNIVTVTGAFTVSCSSIANFQINVSLPVASTIVTNDIAGTANLYDGVGVFGAAFIASGASNTASILGKALTTTGGQPIYITFTYIVH